MTTKWPWPEYLGGAPDPLHGWEVPKITMDDKEILSVFLSALRKLAKVHMVLENVPDLDAPYVIPDNTARNRMKYDVREARKQMHIALAAMSKEKE